MQEYWKHARYFNWSKKIKLIKEAKSKWKLRFLEIKWWNIQTTNQYETLKVRNFYENWRRLELK